MKRARQLHLSGCCCIALPTAFHKFFLLPPTEADFAAPEKEVAGAGWLREKGK